ncbi:XK-related protein [Daphnia magna]|uniref:XK-related protein n=1 Tax=Daphnia magna TaxID=35525 RepID=A0A164JKM8_9CRUS|nr:XK-related protein [Daphnia magna]
MRNSREDKERITWVGLALQAAWRTGTMVSRVIALLLCASVLHLWFLLVIAIHWVGMTVWTIKQKTDLCSTAWEERIYNAIVGVIYCFCFFNIKEGHSRQRAVVFYTVTATENAACLAMFLRFSRTHQDRPWFDIAAPTLIIIGSILGAP